MIRNEGGYTKQQIFSVAEIAFCWKRVPSGTFTAREEKPMSNFITSEERVTLLLGAKAADKVESEKVGLKLNIQKTKIMAAGPITSWEIDGETMSDFIFLGSKITADGDCSHEIKRPLLLGRKVMTNLDSIFKSRDITLPTKVHLV